MADARFFGDGLKYLEPSDLKGKLIAIEGTDGVGRTTHLEMLQEWLEVQGYGVMTTGWTRSNLAKRRWPRRQHLTVGRSVSYATDRRPPRTSDHSGSSIRFVDQQLYIYTAFRFVQRRPEVRTYSDCVDSTLCVIRIDVETLHFESSRPLMNTGNPAWISGSEDLYDSFKKYQSL